VEIKRMSKMASNSVRENNLIDSLKNENEIYKIQYKEIDILYKNVKINSDEIEKTLYDRNSEYKILRLDGLLVKQVCMHVCVYINIYTYLYVDTHF
jgi:hypothetical protein